MKNTFISTELRRIKMLFTDKAKYGIRKQNRKPLRNIS
jgi:hypothetical protein